MVSQAQSVAAVTCPQGGRFSCTYARLDSPAELQLLFHVTSD
jgi:hypothetical protein